MRRPVPWVALLVALGASAALSCHRPTTSVRVHVLSDLSLSMVRLRAWRGLEAEEPPAATPDPRALTRDVSASATPGALTELGSFTLMPEAQGQWNVPFTVRAQGFAQGGTTALATQIVTASYQENEQRELFVYLLARCGGVTCCAGQTCGCNGCEAQLASRTLPRDTAAPACGAGADAGVLEASVCPASDAGLDATGEAGQDAAPSEGGDASTGDGGPCVPGSTRDCYEPSSPLAGVGACTRGTQFCLLGGVYSACMGMGMPAAELCDNIDNNCNGTVDEGLTVTCYADVDGDGYAPTTAAAVQRCPVMGRDATGGCPGGYTNRRPQASMPTTIDCDDANGGRSPGRPELCDSAMVDEDCDGVANPASLCACASGTAPRACPLPGRCSTGTQTCAAGVWGACSVLPTSETCNGIDDDCNGMVDDGLGSTSCGNGNCRRTMQNCHQGAPQACTPDATQSTAELCDGLDNDCDGVADNGVRVACYTDMDGDTYAPMGAVASQQCVTAGRASVGGCPAGYTNRAPTTANTDCNDSSLSINPAAPEVCDSAMVDENCSGTANEGCTCTTGMVRACSQPGRCASGMQTCAAGIWGACSIAPVAETCNGIDDDCNGMVDDGIPSMSCGAGVCQRTVASCSMGMSVACTPDTTRMGAELCDNVDNDCNGSVDDGAAATSCAAVVHATPSCSAGVCGYTTCAAGYGDCDGNRLNGCETALNTAANCGACGSSCGAGGSCVGGTTCDTISELAAGGGTVCVRRSGGSVACWGNNSSGQLGTATTAANSAVPVNVGGSPTNPLNAVTAISVGSASVCMVMNGYAYCWGANSNGELGRGSTSSFARDASRVMLTATGPLTGVQEVRVGSGYACARATNGGVSTIYCWGSNTFGLLGNGTSDATAHPYATPVPTPMVSGSAISWLGLQSASDTTACATAQVPVAGGSPYVGVYCWGDGTLGALGIGSSPGTTRPTLVVGPMATTPAMGVLGLGVNSGSSSVHCYRLAGGVTYCFGENYFGNLGNGTTANTNAATTAVRSGATSVSLSGVAIGGRHACGFAAAGSTYCWGDNDYAQLGASTVAGTCAFPPMSGGCSNVAVVVTGVQASAIAAGDGFTCALPTGSPSRQVRCWGDSRAGQCGSVSASPVATPALIGGL